MRVLTIGLAAGAVLLAVVPGAIAQGAGERDNRRAERFIDLLDTDEDGSVSKAEIAAEYQRLFGAADLDGDGTLSSDEFRRRGRLFQSVGAVTFFDMLDANSDQQLTVDEITAPSARWVTRYDGNGDDALDRDEFPTRPRHGR